MDRQLLERMIGAGVLMAALVIIAPAILDGQRDSRVPAYNSDTGGNDAEMRTHKIRLNQQPEKPPAVRQATKPVPVATPGAAPKPARAAPKSAGVKVAAAAPKLTAPASPAKSSGGWSIQLGSFARQENADRLGDEVGGHGFDTFVVPLEQSDRTLYRVRVGSGESRAEAEKLAKRLVKAGYKGQLTPP
jgi:cell division septation protein DedD